MTRPPGDRVVDLFDEDQDASDDELFDWLASMGEQLPGEDPS